ncbi:hypothetical protein PAMA_007697 [Pampus argenteus]
MDRRQTLLQLLSVAALLAFAHGQCPVGWREYEDKCYFFSSDTKTWGEANAFCTEQNSNLMSIRDIHERLWVRTQISTEIYWIGLTDEVEEGVWEWSDGTPFYEYLSYWKQGQPDNWGDDPGEDCGQVVGASNGQWNDEKCNARRKYICKYLNPNPTPRCDSANGWREYGSNCYKLKADNTKSWTAARHDCVQDGGDLVSVLSAEEEEYVTGILDSSRFDLWIGLSTLLWFKRVFSNSDTQAGSCSAIIKDSTDEFGKWRSHACRYERPYMCKRPLNNKDQDGEFRWADKTGVTFSNYGSGWPRNTEDTWDCGQIFTDSHCDAGYLLYGDFCYHFETEMVKNWQDAESYCNTDQGHLASFHSVEDLSFLTAHIAGPAWVGLNDINVENTFVYTDGTPADFLQWATGQPDNWQNNEDCIHIRGTNQQQPGTLNDDICTNTKSFICKKGWDDKCGSWTSDPFNDYCYLFNYLSLRTWAEARADCVNQGGDLISITEPFEQAFIQGVILQSPTGISLWMGGHDSITEGGWEWMDGSPFRYIRWNAGNPDNYNGEDCLSILINNGYWNDDNCENKRGYICKRRGFMTALVCQDSSAVIHCPVESVINIQSAFYGRKSEDICPHLDGSGGGSCTVDGILPQYRKSCDNLPYCFAYAHTEVDPCPTVSKYLEIVYSCEQKVCLHALGVEDGNITDSQLIASSSVGLFTPDKARLNGNSCWMPSGNPTSSWLQVNLGQARKVTGLVIQGCPNNDHWLTKFKIQHSVDGTTWTDYTADGADSNICAAAIHAGVVLNDVGGDCTLLKAPGQDFYAGSTRNGITTRHPTDVNESNFCRFDGSYDVSYTFADGELRCSGPDWYEFGDFCYKPFEDKKTWNDAQDTCRGLGAELVSILSMTEQSWLESYLYLATSDVWTGLNDMFEPGMFAWSDEHMVTFTYWAPGEPNNYAGFSEDCVEMLYQTGRWNDVPCTELNTYICKMPKAHYAVPSVKPTVYGCPQGWDAYGYACYWMEETPRSWSDAKAFCTEQDGFLLHLGDIYEQAHFTVKLSGKTGFWWIGLRARGGTIGGVDYIWDNGSPLTFTHWDRNQPDSGDGTCVAMTSGQIGGFWDDKQCSEEYNFICEKPRPDITPPTKAPTPPPAQGCADGWTAQAHFRNCYKLFQNVDWSLKKSWGAAHEDCVSRGADLVSIHSYSWSDGTPLTHTNWGHGEPNNHDGREECVEMVSSTNGTHYYWNDINCDAHQDWICMITKGVTPILPPQPPSPVPAPDCGSNPGWRKNDGICYYYNDTDIVDFHTAMRRCYAEKASLVSILSKDEQAYVNTMVGTGEVSAAWIGMRMFGTAGGQYIWLDSSPVVYTHWAGGEPNNANGEEQCVQMNRHQGGWNDANCGRAGAGYVCKKFPGDNHTPAPPTQPWEGNCPAGWMRFKNKCFMFKGKKNDIKANWSYARSWCKDQGGELAIIDDQYENDFVSSYLKDLELPTWIGLSDQLQENQYAWSDGVSPVLYTNWNNNEPNNAGGAEHCVTITHNHLVSGKWNDDACHKDQSFVCYMKKSSSIDPVPTQSSCPAGYISWYLNCYKLVEEPATWDAAQTACQQEGGNLASIDMSYDQAFVAGVVIQGKADAWIGLRRKDDGSYTWTDGWPVFFTQWGPGEPSNIKDEGCVSMHASRAFHGTWNDTKCDQAKPYICKISSEKPPSTPAPGDGKCLQFWMPYGQYCYYVYNGQEGFTWPTSQHYCQSVRAELVSIHSRAEVEFIRNLNYTKRHNIWIGLTRDRNFGWGWTDLTSLGFLNWAQGEPNTAGHHGDASEENCVEMYDDGRWNDNNCLQKRGFACRHRQYYATDDGGNPIFPTDSPPMHGGVIAAAIIAAVVVCSLIAGLLYYVFSMRGYKISGLSLPTKTTSKVEVPSFNNPNFADESDT